MKKMFFSHPRYKRFSGRYLVSSTGRVFRADGTELNYHKMCSGGRFVRLSGGKGLLRSMTVGKMVLLAFEPRKYRRGMIAVHRDGDVTNDRLSNLFFGTRKDQTAVSMKKPSYRKRVSMMAKNYYLTDSKTKIIRRFHRMGLEPSQIARRTGFNQMTVYIHLKKIKIGV
jgi:hypothetical protein